MKESVVEEMLPRLPSPEDERDAFNQYTAPPVFVKSPGPAQKDRQHGEHRDPELAATPAPGEEEEEEEREALIHYLAKPVLEDVDVQPAACTSSAWICTFSW